MTVYVANRFKLDWIRAQYAGKIASMAEKLYGQPVVIELALAPREIPVRPVSMAIVSETDVPRDVIGPGDDLAAAAFEKPAQLGPHFRHPGRGHGQPHGARRRDARGGMPGHLYNPFFIYGGVGLARPP